MFLLNSGDAGVLYSMCSGCVRACVCEPDHLSFAELTTEYHRLLRLIFLFLTLYSSSFPQSRIYDVGIVLFANEFIKKPLTLTVVTTGECFKTEDVLRLSK